jgi:hypothetical protein
MLDAVTLCILTKFDDIDEEKLVGFPIPNIEPVIPPIAFTLPLVLNEDDAEVPMTRLLLLSNCICVANLPVFLVFPIIIYFLVLLNVLLVLGLLSIILLSYII